jgi:hypothetical protein
MASTIKVNNIQNQCGANIINESANTITIGASGDTVSLASGASQTGFGRTGTVDWDTTAKTASFTAVSGNGYFVNTTSGAITVTLPAGSAGSIVSLKDYANTWNTNNVTLTPNGTDKINGSTGNATLSTQDQSVTLVYVDDTKGWRAVQDSTSDVSGAAFIAATGGTVLTCGDFKTHVFTGPGTFCVSCGGNSNGSNTVEYLVVAGGGGGGEGTLFDSAGGGGAGGFRTRTSLSPASPLNAPANLPVSAQAYPITVGAGGNGALSQGGGNTGANSIFSSITSAGGGLGEFGASPTDPSPANGGSGGGVHQQAISSGNQPPVSPPQGQPGGTSGPSCTCTPNGGGGGGAAAAGPNATAPTAADGGAGSFIPTSFIGPTAPSYGESGPAGRYFAGGGAGGTSPSRGSQTNGSGGLGGGGNTGSAATANTGGGGGGAQGTSPSGGNGGSGIVIIRYKFQ